MRDYAMTVDAMTADDWPAVRAIYEEGLATGLGSLETTAPTWEEWDAARLPHSRLVARDDGTVIAWAALSAVSKRACYAGVAELGIYASASARGRVQQGCGFRLVGRRERIGKRDGVWRDTVILERRSGIVGIE